VWALTSQILNEILCWEQLDNRRQVASLTGCALEFEPAVTNSRVVPLPTAPAFARRLMNWLAVVRATRLQTYKATWRVLLNPKSSAASKKKPIVVGRLIAVGL
jgi:hypothetical protein